MTINFSSACQFKDNLEQAALAVEQELGDRAIANQLLLTQALQSSAGVLASLADARAELNRILQLPPVEVLVLTTSNDESVDKKLLNGEYNPELVGGAPISREIKYSTTEDVITNGNLMSKDATKEDKEVLLGDLGLPMFDGIILVPATESDTASDLYNIDNLRGVYGATQSLEETEKILTAPQPTVEVVWSELDLAISEIKPTKPSYFLSDTNSYYSFRVGNPKINVFRPSNTCVSTAVIKRKAGKGRALQHAEINRLRKLGIDGDRLSAIRLDEREWPVLHLPSNPAEAMWHGINSKTSNFLKYLDFVATRSGQKGFKVDFNRIENTSKEILNDFLSLVAFVKTRGIYCFDAKVLEKLGQLFGTEKIKFLLEERPDIVDFFPEASVQLKLEYMDRPRGISLRNNKVDIASPWDEVTLLAMLAKLDIASKTLHQLRVSTNTKKTQLIRGAINFYLDYFRLEPYAPAVTPPGMKSVVTGAQLVIETVKIEDTFQTAKLSQQFGETVESELLQLYPSSVARPLAQVLTFVTSISSAAICAFETMLNLARGTILAVQSQVSSFLDEYINLIGSGSFENSILKCAVNIDFSVGTSLFDNLLILLENFAALVSNFVSSLIDWASDLITKILCLPINLINQFLGAVESLTAGICAIPDVTLPDSVNEQLKLFSSLVKGQRQMMASFIGGLTAIRLNISNAPDQLQQLRDGSVCESESVNKFIKASFLNISVGI